MKCRDCARDRPCEKCRDLPDSYWESLQKCKKHGRDRSRKSKYANSQLAAFTAQLQSLRRELGEMRHTVDSERKLRLEAENKLKGMSEGTLKSRRYRRMRSPLRP